jgi:hypothetical protein
LHSRGDLGPVGRNLLQTGQNIKAKLLDDSLERSQRRLNIYGRSYKEDICDSTALVDLGFAGQEDSGSVLEKIGLKQ